MKIILAVFIGGGIGSLARFGVSHLALKWFESGFPWGTFIANMLACLVLAVTVLLYKDILIGDSTYRYLIITGFCGGFSTFSTFSYENFALIRAQQTGLALANVAVSVLLGIIIMYLIIKNVHVHE